MNEFERVLKDQCKRPIEIPAEAASVVNQAIKESRSLRDIVLTPEAKNSIKSRAKYRRGPIVTSLNELMEQKFVYWNDKITHHSWFCNWQLRMAN